MVCLRCGRNLPRSVVHCPDCGLGAGYPNVRDAQNVDERQTLLKLYQNQLERAATRGSKANEEDFERSVEHSQAVMVRTLAAVLWLAESDSNLVSTYSKMIEGEVRLPDGNEWDLRREYAAVRVFPHYGDNIRFAALSLDGVGLLSSYGTCSITLKDGMIQERSTVFAGNSALLPMNGSPPPRGVRATWLDRAKLAVAELSDAVNAGTDPHEFPAILLRQGTPGVDQTYIEVHIWGSMSVRTFERVVLTADESQVGGALVAALREELLKNNVPLTFVK